jgi:hypothetical protein
MIVHAVALPVYAWPFEAQHAEREPQRKGMRPSVGPGGFGVVAMAANALSFFVGVILPLSGVLWLILH